MSRTRTRSRWRLSLTATTLLAASFLVPAPVNAAAEDITDYTITVDPPMRARTSPTPCTASSSRTSTAPPTAACTPSWCGTGRSSTDRPTTRSYTAADRVGRHRHREDRGRRRPPQRAQPHLPRRSDGGWYGHQLRLQHGHRGREGQGRTTSPSGPAPTAGGTALTVTLHDTAGGELAEPAHGRGPRRRLGQVHRHVHRDAASTDTGRLSVRRPAARSRSTWSR